MIECEYLDCQCECDKSHKKCKQTMCDWRKEKLLILESIKSLTK